jgi:hypothetical protein
MSVVLKINRDFPFQVPLSFDEAAMTAHAELAFGQSMNILPLKLGTQTIGIMRFDEKGGFSIELWAKWKDPKSGDEIQSCTILTCGPNDSMAQLHDRMRSFWMRRIGRSGWAKNLPPRTSYWRSSNPAPMTA